MRRGKHTNQEKAAILSQTTLKLKDIRILEDCGAQKAREKAQAFKEWFESTYKQDIDCVPTAEYIKFANYPEKRVLRYAQLGY